MTVPPATVPPATVPPPPGLRPQCLRPQCLRSQCLRPWCLGPQGPRRASGDCSVTGQDEAGPGQAAVPDPAADAGRERLEQPVARTGMFGTETSGGTSGYGGLLVRRPPRVSSPRPFGSYFDDVADALASALRGAGVNFDDAVEQVIVRSGDLTFYVRREHLLAVMSRLRDDPALAFELCPGVSGVHYPAQPGAELHAVYHLLSITHNPTLRLEVTAPDPDPHVPSPTRLFPPCAV